MFCEKCGNEIENGDNFCGRCGNKTGSSSSKVPGKSKRKLKDEFIIDTLSQYCSSEDPLLQYVLGYSNPSVVTSILFGYLALADRRIFLVGVTRTKLILVCIDPKLKEKAHSILSFHQMDSIDIFNGMLTKKIKVTMPDKSNLVINVRPSVRGIKNQKKNLNEICEKFSENGQ